MNLKTMVRILALLFLIAALFLLQALYQQVSMLKQKDPNPRRKAETRVIYRVSPDFAQKLAEQAEANRLAREGGAVKKAEPAPAADAEEAIQGGADRLGPSGTGPVRD